MREYELFSPLTEFSILTPLVYDYIFHEIMKADGCWNWKQLRLYFNNSNLLIIHAIRDADEKATVMRLSEPELQTTWQRVDNHVEE